MHGMNCSICTAVITRETSCSAQPLNDGRCCWACDNMIVTPVRVARSHMSIVTAIETALQMHKSAEKLRAMPRR
jgi:hypothetical protein